MVDAARGLQGEPDPQATLDLAARLAVSNVVGCDAAAISVVQRHRGLRVAAYTEDLALAGVLSRFSRAERAAIPIVAAGAPLRAGETYLDLLRANRRPFEAMGSLTALSSQRLVPKSAVAKELWLQLL